MRHKQSQHGLEHRKSWYGRLFVLPWVLGILLFFLLPLVQSIVYSFSHFSFTPEGIHTEWAGWKHYAFALWENPKYTENLAAAISSMLVSLPVILILSLLIAIVLNRQFRGRTLFRAIFFLPVIITAGVVIKLLFQYTSAAEMTGDLAVESQSYLNSMIDMEGILQRIGLPAQVVAFFSTAITNIFNLVWNCGIQIVLFIAGMQTIPGQLYEVSRVEGATGWEEFWFITLPLLGRVTLLVMVFTMIELFTAETNPVISQAYRLMKQQNYDESSAMLWIYFTFVSALLALLLLLYQRCCLRRWE